MRFFLTSFISLLSLTSVANAADSYSPVITLRDQQTAGFPNGGYYVTPIHYNFLPSSGKVLVTGWGRSDPQQCSATGSRKFGVSFTLDPVNIDGATNGGNFNVFPISDAPRTAGEVLYCSGHSPLDGGKILYVGGSAYTNLGQSTQTEVGLDYARIYNPSTNSYTRIPTSMPIGTAWYPTAARLPDGRILISGGFYKCCSGDSEANNQLVTFDPIKYNTNPNDATVWQLLVPQFGSAASRGDFVPGLRDYTRIFVLHQNININNIIYDVAMMGKQGRILLFSSNPNTPPNQKWYVKPYSQRNVPGSSDCGADTTSLIAWTGELVIAFGCNPNGFPTSRIDLYNPVTDTWRSIDASARKNAASVLLPNGDILFMNGENPSINQDSPSLGDPRYPVVLRITESSLSLSWGTNDGEFRGYHNAATLLKDGRVLTGGGIWKSGDIGCEHPTARIYTPKYLNDFGARPQWLNPPAQPWILTLGGMGTGATITFQYTGVTSLHDLHPVVLTAVGSTTHSYDPNARMIRLTVASRASGSITVRVPWDQQYVLAGEYLLWLVSNTGVPSVGLHARVERGTSCSNCPTTPPPSNNGDPSQWKRAVIFIRKQTVSGQDIFVRGGHDGDLVNQGKYSSMNVPIIFVNTKTNAQAKQNTPYLNWFSSAPLAWTAPAGSAGQPLYSDVGYGQDSENTCCQHNWKLDVLVKGNVGDWFEFKAFMTQSGQADQWESNIQQAGTPYQTINHWARIGYITSVTFGQNVVTQTPIANPSVTSLPYAWNGATTSNVETPVWVSDPINYTGVVYDQPSDKVNSATIASSVMALMFSTLFAVVFAF